MRDEIKSVRNQRVLQAIRLRNGRHRRKSGLTIIDGMREVSRAFRAGVEIVELFIERSHLPPSFDETLLIETSETGTAVLDVSPTVFEKLSFGNRSDGIVAVARPRLLTIDQLTLPPCPIVFVLDRVEKPGNIGAIVRTADGAGAHAVVVCNSATDLYNPNAVRASLGTIFAFPTISASIESTLTWLQNVKLPLLVARVDGNQLYTDVDYGQGAAIVLGSESTGVSAEWNSGHPTGLRLPMLGVSDSLNVSNVAAVIAYEACRQRETL